MCRVRNSFYFSADGTVNLIMAQYVPGIQGILIDIFQIENDEIINSLYAHFE